MIGKFVTSQTFIFRFKLRHKFRGKTVKTYGYCKQKAQKTYCNTNYMSLIEE